MEEGSSVISFEKFIFSDIVTSFLVFKFRNYVFKVTHYFWINWCNLLLFQNIRMPHTNLDTLPNEVLHNVFRFLNYSDLKSVLLVCKHLMNIGTDPTLWKRIPLSIRSFVPIRNIPRLPSLQNLTIHGQFENKFYLQHLFYRKIFTKDR